MDKMGILGIEKMWSMEKDLRNLDEKGELKKKGRKRIWK